MHGASVHKFILTQPMIANLVFSILIISCVLCGLVLWLFDNIGKDDTIRVYNFYPFLIGGGIGIVWVMYFLIRIMISKL